MRSVIQEKESVLATEIGMVYKSVKLCTLLEVSFGLLFGSC